MAPTPIIATRYSSIGPASQSDQHLERAGDLLAVHRVCDAGGGEIRFDRGAVERQPPLPGGTQVGGLGRFQAIDHHVLEAAPVASVTDQLGLCQPYLAA